MQLLQRDGAAWSRALAHNVGDGRVTNDPSTVCEWGVQSVVRQGRSVSVVQAHVCGLSLTFDRSCKRRWHGGADWGRWWWRRGNQGSVGASCRKTSSQVTNLSLEASHAATGVLVDHWAVLDLESSVKL